MDVIPKILFGKVMHKRLLPKINAFTYGIYYLCLPLAQIETAPLPIEHGGFLSFYRKDHGARDGTDLQNWIKPVLKAHGIQDDLNITLITMPRVLGYVFNPVSFWLCHDASYNLCAVLCEVNNTFGETHSYICAHEDGRPMNPEDCLYGEKFFHVSPFLEREGKYRFRFQFSNDIFGAWIDHYNANGDLQLLTTLTGKLRPMTKSSLREAFWHYPLVTLKAVGLIHWQAVKLILKGIRYVPKPLQNKENLTTTHIKKL